MFAESLYVWVYVIDDAIPVVSRKAGLNVKLTRRGYGSEHDRSIYRVAGQYFDIHLHDAHETVFRTFRSEGQCLRKN